MGEPRTTPHRTSPKLPIRVQFAHGLESSARGTKARVLAEHFDAVTPEMDTADFEACVAAHADALRGFRPDVLVGSSFGGAVAVELLTRGLWRGPTLLLAQAAVRLRGDARLPEGVAVWLVHGLRDETIDPEDSRRLAATGSPQRVRLIEVDDDHRLARSVAGGRLVEWVRDLAEGAAEPPPRAGARLRSPSA
jgi:pimeloyl-ACP methyl ester carboxylesterase